MGRFRALKPLQAPKLGLVQPGRGPDSEFDWDGSIIGWHVEPLDDDARAMVADRAKTLKAQGAEVAEDRPLPTQIFPSGVMKAASGMTAPAIVADTMNDIATPDSSAPQMSAPPRRRRAS